MESRGITLRKQILDLKMLLLFKNFNFLTVTLFSFSRLFFVKAPAFKNLFSLIQDQHSLLGLPLRLVLSQIYQVYKHLPSCSRMVFGRRTAISPIFISSLELNRVRLLLSLVDFYKEPKIHGPIGVACTLASMETVSFFDI